MRGSSFEFFLIYLEQSYPSEAVYLGEAHEMVIDLMNKDPELLLDLYLNFLLQWE